MKKVTLSSYPRMLCILVLLLMTVLSCRKDRGYIEPIVKKNGEQVIKQELIEKWFATTPASMILTLDWKNARQAVIDGNKVVRVPTLNVDKTSFYDGAVTLSQAPQSAGKNDKTMQAVTAETAPPGVLGQNTNYFKSHPPEVFFMQQAHSDKLLGTMVNFVPTDTKKEFGQDRVWTGTLYSWNLKGDTIIAKEYVKNKVVNYYGLRNPTTISNKTSAVATNSSKTSAINTQSSFFGWLADLVADIVGWIAYALGANTHFYDHNGIYGPGWRIEVTGGDDSTGGGGGGGVIGGVGGPTGTLNVSGSYLDGTANSQNYNSYPAPDGSQGYNNQIVPADVIYLIDVLGQHDASLMDYMWNKLWLSHALVQYLSVRGESSEELAFVNWALQYLRDNNSSEEEINLFIRDFLTEGEGQDGDLDDDGLLQGYMPQIQPLPTFNAYLAAYPHDTSPNPNGNTNILGRDKDLIYAQVGGALNAKHISGNLNYDNACAIRASIALNYCGYDIPIAEGLGARVKTEKGADGKNYILSAVLFNTYMHVTFGPPTYTLTEQQIAASPTAVANFFTSPPLEKKGYILL